MTYALAPGVSFGSDAETTIVLDLYRDRYSRLGPGVAQALAAIAAGNPLTESTRSCASALVDAGLLVDLSDVDDMAPVHNRLGVPEKLQGCHAGEIDGYVIEGHVPPLDVLRLLRDRPAARGLSVAGMPQGAIGMETGTSDPYQVLLFKADGSSTVFAGYG